MPASDIAVSVRGLSKSYTIAHQGEKHITLYAAAAAAIVFTIGAYSFKRMERKFADVI